MTMRIHQAQAKRLGVQLITHPKRLVELGYADEFDAIILTPALVIEDALNQEAWVIYGTLAEFSQLGYDIAVTLGNDTASDDPLDVGVAEVAAWVNKDTS